MAELLLTNLDDSLVHRLKENAARHGISVEEEAKRVLTSKLKSEKKEAITWMREFREQNAHLQKTNTLDLLHEGRERR